MANCLLVESIDTFPDSWHDVRLLDASLTPCISYVLAKVHVTCLLLPLVTISQRYVLNSLVLNILSYLKLQVGDCVVSMAYNGYMTQASINEHFENTPEAERAPVKINPQAAQSILGTDTKSIAPGQIVVVGTPGYEADRLVFSISCTLYAGSSGGPVFLIRPSATPVVIGLGMFSLTVCIVLISPVVLAGRVWRTFNLASRFTPAMLQMLEHFV